MLDSQQLLSMQQWQQHFVSSFFQLTCLQSRSHCRKQRKAALGLTLDLNAVDAHSSPTCHWWKVLWLCRIVGGYLIITCFYTRMRLHAIEFRVCHFIKCYFVDVTQWKFCPRLFPATKWGIGERKERGKRQSNTRLETRGEERDGQSARWKRRWRNKSWCCAIGTI